MISDQQSAINDQRSTINVQGQQCKNNFTDNKLQQIKTIM